MKTGDILAYKGRAYPVAKDGENVGSEPSWIDGVWIVDEYVTGEPDVAFVYDPRDRDRTLWAITGDSLPAQSTYLRIIGRDG